RIIGSAEALLASIARPAARATGLRDRLLTKPRSPAALPKIS
ncbi:MAG: hypothetical protein QOJ83_1244, partial [Frankiales bacterium]|nr:hypothetical protein [Frankiales bacterium]